MLLSATSCFGWLFLFMSIASSTADEPIKRNFSCGKHFRFEYHNKDDFHKGVDQFEKKDFKKHFIHISDQDTELTLSTSNKKNLHNKDENGNLHPCHGMSMDSTSEYAIKLTEKGEILESALRLDDHNGKCFMIDNDSYFHGYISDTFSDHFYPFYKIHKNRTDWYYEIDPLSTTVKIAQENMAINGNINNGTGMFHLQIAHVSDGQLVDDIHENERASKIRGRAMESVFWGQDVPKTNIKNFNDFYWDTKNLKVDYNVTYAELETGDTELWTLLEVESIQWPQLDAVYNLLHMTRNKTSWGAGFSKSFWHRATLRDDAHGGHRMISAHFNSDFPISSVVLDDGFRNGTFEVKLDCLDSQWKFSLEFTSSRGYSLTLTRTVIWTQHRTPITVLKITDEVMDSPENEEQSCKMVISNLQNFNRIFKNLNDLLSKLQVNELRSLLMEERLLRKVLELVSIVVDGLPQAKLMMKVDNLEHVLKKAGKFIAKVLTDLVKETHFDIKDFFVKSLKSFGGDYIEEEDQVIIMYSNSFFQRLPLYFYNELNVLCEQL